MDGVNFLLLCSRMSSPITLIPPAESPLYHERPKSIRLADPKKGPPDECNLVYIIVFLLGIGAHFPWNVLLAGQDYFKSRLQHVPMARDFLSHFTIIFMSVKYLITLTAMFSLRKVCCPCVS